MPSIERSFYYSTPALSVLFFSIFERSVLMALVVYYKDILELKNNDAKNPAVAVLYTVEPAVQYSFV